MCVCVPVTVVARMCFFFLFFVDREGIRGGMEDTPRFHCFLYAGVPDFAM